MTTPDDLRDGPTSAGGDVPPTEPPITDPAHRFARWAMVLTPVVLGVLVYLLLRLSTR